MSYPGGMSQLCTDQQEQENESGMDLCEAWHYEQDDDEMIEVCMYCGKERPKNHWQSCCGEMHFEFVKENANV